MELNKTFLSEKLKNGEIAVMPTDTIYGVVGSAKIPETVEKIYKLKSRKTQKPLIILISSLKDLEFFKIKLTIKEKGILEKVWPGKVSVILPCDKKEFYYLHRGQKSLAFRMPKKENLLRFLKIAGPLVAPSANPEGLPPAKTIAEAKKYFGRKVDIYINDGKLESLPSTLIRISAKGGSAFGGKNKKVKILRQGEVKLNCKKL